MDVTIQLMSLFLSVIYLVASAYLATTCKSGRQWIYVILSLGWLGGVTFYTLLLYTGVLSGYGHIYSIHLRLFQYVCFGSWIILRAFEKLFATDSMQKLQQRMVAWITKLRKIS